MPNKYFYCTGLKLKENSIIEKGNNPINLEIGVPFAFGENKNTIIELILEIVRLEKFPSKPKRSESLFVCRSLKTLFDFAKTYRTAGTYYYEVEAIKENYNYHFGDYLFGGLLEKNCGCYPSEDVWKRFKYKDLYNYGFFYWNDKPLLETEEMVIDSPIKIIKELYLD